MEWLWLGVAALLGLFVGSLRRKSAPINAPIVERLSANLAQDRELALRTLRRELANYVVRADPNRYLQLYRKARAAEIAIKGADKRAQQEQLAEITEKYPFYEDFNFIGKRVHVLYADALSRCSHEEVENHFMNLVKFQALQQILDEHWRRFSATTDDDLEHLEKYARKIEDTKFKQRLDEAIREFFVFLDAKRLSRLDANSEGLSYVYETDVLAACFVPHIPESRYGFHFKDTNEFGLYGAFYSDDDRTFESFYRSNASFEAEIYIHHLGLEGPI